MPRIQGIILDRDEHHRLIRVKTPGRIVGVHFQRAAFNRFAAHLVPGVLIIVNTRHRVRRRHPAYRLQATEVLALIARQRRGRKRLYSRTSMRRDIRAFVNTLDVKMFLDLELSMHPYKPDPTFKQEIIQAGYVLVDGTDTVIERYSAVIKPTVHKRLSKRTLKFLSVTQEDVDNGLDYQDFYTHFRDVVEKTRPAIVVWGKNDGLSLKESYDINRLPDLSATCRIVNLLELHKNYYHLKDDLGLANAHRLYGHETSSQRHDALEDAMMTHDVFIAFKAVLNNERGVDLNALNALNADRS